MVTEQVRVAVPDIGSGRRLRLALGGLEADLRGLLRDHEIVITLKAPERGIMLDTIVGTIGCWLKREELPATRMQVGNQAPTFLRTTIEKREGA